MSNISPRNYLNDTLALKATIETSFLVLGERLRNIREDKLYMGEYETFDEFLLTAKISKASASKLITVYETFIMKFKMAPKQLAEVGWSSLYAIAGHADTKEKAKDLVQKAGLLTRDHLLATLKEDGEGHNHCKHADTRVVEVCNNCSHRRQIFNLSELKGKLK